VKGKGTEKGPERKKGKEKENYVVGDSVACRIEGELSGVRKFKGESEKEKRTLAL